MSFVPSQYLVRLQELKLWQGNYDNLLQKQKNSSIEDKDFSDLDGLDGVTPIREYQPNEKTQINPSKPMDWEKQTIIPKTKPFDELVEEKLAEDKPVEVHTKTKQPFLRKGSGLARYKLDPNTKKFKQSKIVHNDKEKCNTIFQFNEEPCTGESSITPLKAPEISIKCKATWTKVDNDVPVKSFQTNVDNFNTQYVIEKINEFAQSNHSSKKFNDDIQDIQSVSNFESYNNDDFLESSFSNKSDKELKIFETLEEKINHSSFLSTNASIIRLLASTPNSIHTSPKSKAKNESSNDCQELRSSNVLTKILNNLKLISAENANGCSIDYLSRTNGSNSFSEERKFAKHSDTSCHSPSSFYSDFENTLGQFEKIDTAVNTSFSYQAEDDCQKCKDLQRKLNRLLHESSQSAVEKTKLYDTTKELNQKCTLLTTEIERLKTNYEKDVEDLREELNEERKKFTREKAILDMYIKDVRPKKKDSLELESLKQEMVDLKELMKLKETKNGTTQARLRNQIRQLEKEKSELKSSVEHLQKENAKLNATQKVQRNAESRMLQEISRNLNRLTEETMKDTNSVDVTQDNQGKVQKKVRRKSMGELKEKVERELHIQQSKEKNKNSPMDNTKKISPTVEVIYNNELIDKTLEKHYESALGLVNDEFNQNEEHQLIKVLIERDFPDGSKEIKFTNGASKTISPDGKLIYLQYSNGDLKETNLINNTQKYYFLKKNIWLTKHSDGTEVIEFPNGQKEKRFPDGKVEVTAQDGTTVTTSKEGIQEVNYPDGSRMIKNKDEKIIFLPNGQKETHTPQFKKREYPDGTVKIIYPDGTQESRYANGRIRIKDENGTLIMDSHITEIQ